MDEGVTSGDATVESLSLAKSLSRDRLKHRLALQQAVILLVLLGLSLRIAHHFGKTSELPPI